MLTYKIGITLIKMIHRIAVTGRNGSSGSAASREIWKFGSKSISPVDMAMVLNMAYAGVENVSRCQERVGSMSLPAYMVYRNSEVCE